MLFLKILFHYSLLNKLIDWQCDFISGYRWNENEISKNLKYGDKLGADVKVPWEIGRMQHLLIFPIAYKLALANKINISPEIILNEYQNQIIDFIASNPRYFGIQWKSTMDVSIRMLSIIVSFQLLISEGIEFSKEFKNIILNSIKSHIDHSIENLEWSSGMRGNHYLASICSIIITCIITQNMEGNVNYLTMATSELFNEIIYQFNSDGSNFEGSTQYHYFCFEMISIALISLSSLSDKQLANIFSKANNNKLKVKNLIPSISKNINDRLNNILSFSYSNIINNSSWNIGDNDSGKFLKLIPKYHYKNITIDNNSSDLAIDYEFYSQLIKLLCDEKSELENFFINYSNKFNLRLNKNQLFFKNLGLYLFKNEKYIASFKCGKIGQLGKGGHSHNDQLNLLLKIDNKDFLIDNGTFTYTADPNQRNKFRGTSYHNVINVRGKEQNYWSNKTQDDLFWLKGNNTKSKITNLTHNKIIGVHSGFGNKCIREITFNSTSIDIIDTIYDKSTIELNLYISHFFKIINNKENKITFISVDNENINELKRVKKISISINIENGNGLFNTINVYEVDTSIAYGVLEKATLINITNKNTSSTNYLEDKIIPFEKTSQKNNKSIIKWKIDLSI